MTQRNDPPDPDDPVVSRHAESLLEPADAAVAEHAAADSAAHADLLAAGPRATCDAEKFPEKN